MVVCLGDLVEDVVVRPAGPLRHGTDTAAAIERRRGGSAANVAVAVAGAGGRARFVGCVGADHLGDRLVTELVASAVEVAVARAGRTGSVVAVLSPDGDRSFYTDRGAATRLDHLPEGWVEDATVLHLPLYSFDGEPLASTAAAAAAGFRQLQPAGLISVDASSVAVIERVGAAVAAIQADVVFANEAEAAALGPVPGATIVIKRGPRSTLINVAGSNTSVEVDQHGLGLITDTVGAGDAFAAGYLLAAAGGAPPAVAAAAGHRRAADHLRTLHRPVASSAEPWPGPALQSPADDRDRRRGGSGRRRRPAGGGP
jgi:sugar/nucleoside kinase (ribokinase family)